MGWLKWIGIGLVALIALSVIGFGAGLVATATSPPPAGSVSAERIGDGPYSVGRVEMDWVDTSRATPANGDYAGSDERALPTLIWYPEGYEGSSPLVVYSHGFRSNREGGDYLAKHLASYGYVVASANFPLSNGAAPGGSTIEDVSNQPGDVSFIIDQVLALKGEEKPFSSEIDADRIGAMGLSLGGLTTTLVTFHPRWRDPRIKAAVSMAGPADVFGPGFFNHADAPYLVISGTEDAIVAHRTNAAPMPSRIRAGGLLEIEGGTHAGFVGLASGPMRLLGNPDAMACSVTDFSTGGHPFAEKFGDEGDGLLVPDEYVAACTREIGETIGAGRQQQMAKLAVRAFFETVFAENADVRRESWSYLTSALAGDFQELSYLPAERVQQLPEAPEPAAPGDL